MLSAARPALQLGFPHFGTKLHRCMPRPAVQTSDSCPDSLHTHLLNNALAIRGWRLDLKFPSFVAALLDLGREEFFEVAAVSLEITPDLRILHHVEARKGWETLHSEECEIQMHG